MNNGGLSASGNIACDILTARSGYRTQESGSYYDGATGSLSWASGGTGYAIVVKNGIVTGIATS
jgi:hypothetical protein